VFGIGDEISTTKALFHDLGLFTSAESRPPLEAVDDPQRRHLLNLAYEWGAERTRERRSHMKDRGVESTTDTAPTTTRSR
jgi:hypothetical protein